MALTGPYWLRQLTYYSGFSQNNMSVYILRGLPILCATIKIGLPEINQRVFPDLFLGICNLQAFGYNSVGCSREPSF